MESKARAEAAPKAAAEKPELKTSRKKDKKNRSHAKAKEKTGNKSQEEENNEAKIIAASEDYAKAIASAMAETEVETEPNKNITSDTKAETISEAESLPNLDLSIFKSDDIKETIEGDTEIAEITSEVEEGIQRKINTRDEILITENEIWQEEDRKSVV